MCARTLDSLCYDRACSRGSLVAPARVSVRVACCPLVDHFLLKLEPSRAPFCIKKHKLC